MRALDTSPRAAGPLAAFALVALTLPGCGDGPTAPASSRSGEVALRASLPGIEAAGGGGPAAGHFYPLDVGNHWAYQHDLALYFVPLNGPPGPVSGENNQYARDLVCVEHRGDLSYVVEQTTYPSPGLFTYVRYRQDGAGLYEADVSITQPPDCAGGSGRRVFDARAALARRSEGAWAAFARTIPEASTRTAYRASWDRIQARVAAIRALRAASGTVPQTGAPGGVASGEITRLQYPLHPGAHWVVRADPRFESFVEKNEALDLPPGHLDAWRIRMESDLFGPDDHAHFWWGPSGFLKSEIHVEDVTTDPNGIVIGKMVLDESEVLTELSLAGGRFGSP